MSDMLVNLSQLDKYLPNIPDMAGQGIVVRRAMPYERTHLRAFVEEVFDVGWADQAEMCFYQHPVSCFIATFDRRIVGFAAFDGTNLNFFGPTGVDPEFRNRGVGKALLLKCMEAMRAAGYAYAIIGSAGPVDFYRKTVGAVTIDGSVPGIYVDRLIEPEK